MKNNLLYTIFLAILGIVPLNLNGAREQEAIYVSKLTPAFVEQLYNTRGSTFVTDVVDDAVRGDEDGVGIESKVTLLHLISRTNAKNATERQRLYNLAERVVQDNPALVKAKQSEGFTPLHNAAYRGYNKMVALFLKNGANTQKPDYFKGMKPDEWATLGGHRGTSDLIRTFRDTGTLRKF